MSTTRDRNKRNDDTTTGLSRRQFIGSTIAGGAAAGLAAKAVAQRRRVQRDRPAMRPRHAQGGIGFDPDLVTLVSVINGGFNLADYQQAEVLGYAGYLNQQVNMTPTNVAAGQFDPTLDARTGAYDILPWTPRQIRDNYSGQGNMSSTVALRQTTSIQMMISIYGEARLYYKLFKFWNHHVNIDINSNTHQRWLLYPCLRALLENAMSTVHDIVLGSARWPAMLHYLDNRLNTASSPNENYGRELLELHTLGADNGYDQFDIEEVARILTGWSMVINNNPSYGTYVYNSGNHDNGTKTVLGVEYPTDGTPGEQEGFDLIYNLAHHPNTAEYIARKLCRFIYGGINFELDPEEAMVQYVKSVYLDTGGDVKAMLAAMLDQAVLPVMAQRKFKRPDDYLASMCRATGVVITPQHPTFIDTNDTNSVGFCLRDMGMQYNTWGPPNGPVDNLAWASSGTLARWRAANKLAEQQFTDAQTFTIGGGAGLLAQVGANGPGMHAQGFSDLLTGGQMTDKEKQDLSDFLGTNPGEGLLQEGLALAMQMPTFQFI